MPEEMNLYAINPELEEQTSDGEDAELLDGDLDTVAGGTIDGGCVPDLPLIWPN
jgi:hypothetical protein